MVVGGGARSEGGGGSLVDEACGQGGAERKAGQLVSARRRARDGVEKRVEVMDSRTKLVVGAWALGVDHTRSNVLALPLTFRSRPC